jgi:cytidylate kinase
MANTVITIARQYGAAGRQTGEILAEMKGMPCYDKELITLAASKSGMNEDVVADIDEKAQARSFGYNSRKWKSQQVVLLIV